jgi:dihydrofolate reductase
MICAILALDENNLLGKGNTLPWHYSLDLKYFKKTTEGHDVLMGKNTYLSIVARNTSLLPNRKNYVLTRDTNLVPDAIPVRDLDEFIKNYQNNPNNLLFIIGGKRLYEATLPICDRIYLTRIHKIYEGDLYFDTFSVKDFKLISKVAANEELDFEVYERISHVL